MSAATSSAIAIAASRLPLWRSGSNRNVHSIQSSMEGEKGVITATFQMEITPRAGNIVRRETQLRIELERADQRWLIVNIDPRTFFS